MNELLRTMLFLPPQASSVAREIDTLHYFVIIVTMLGAVGITILGGGFLLKYYRRSDIPEPAKYDKGPVMSNMMEGGIIVSLLGLFLMWWWIGFHQFVKVRVPPAETMDIYVTGKQWMWKFAYPDGGHSIAALYVPAGRPVRLIMTSRDVIHSLYIPDFRIKEDVIPGRYTTEWFQADDPGVHDIFCAELCGTNHSTMRGTVVVLKPEDYAKWLRNNSPATEPLAGLPYDEPAVVNDFATPQQTNLARQGFRAAADHGCLRCHSLDGSTYLGPSWAGVYHSTVPLADGTKVYADEEYLTESMMDPQAKLHRGFQAIMPTYHGVISAEETASILELIKMLRDQPTKPWPAPNAGVPLAIPTAAETTGSPQ